MQNGGSEGALRCSDDSKARIRHEEEVRGGTRHEADECVPLTRHIRLPGGADREPLHSDMTLCRQGQ